MYRISYLILIAGGKLITPFLKIKRIYGAQINVFRVCVLLIFQKQNEKHDMPNWVAGLPKKHLEFKATRISILGHSILGIWRLTVFEI